MLLHLTQISLALLCMAIITGFTYVTLFKYLNSTTLTGSDMPSAYAYIDSFNKYFPSIPYWYPQQGAGLSFFAGYPWLGHYLVVLINRISGFSLIHSFNILLFLSFLVTANGIFIYCWTRFKYPQQFILRMLIGLTAAYFYLAAPITYVFTFQWGFFAESASYLFTAPTVIFADLFLELAFKGIRSWKTRTSLALMSIFWTLAFLTHFSTGMGLFHVITVLYISRSLFALYKYQWAALKRTIKIGVLVYLPITALFSWRYLLFVEYTHQVALGGFSGFGLKKMLPNTFPSYGQMLGIEASTQELRQSLNNWSMQIYIWIFASIAILFGWIRNKKLIALGLMTIFAFLNYTNETLMNLMLNAGPLVEFINTRSTWTVFRMVVPIVSAYGAFLLWDLSLISIDHLANKTTNYVKISWNHILRPIILIPAILFGLYLAVFKLDDVMAPNLDELYLQPQKNTYQKEYTKRIGLQQINPANPWKNAVDTDTKVISINNFTKWPRSDFSDNTSFVIPEDISKLVKIVGDDPLGSRFDMSSTHGQQIMYAPLITSTSQTHVYIGQLVLQATLLNYQSYVMHTSVSPYRTSNILSEIAKYFGYNYVLVQDEGAPTDLYDNDPNWEKIDENGWRKFKNPTGLTTWSKKPAVLFIGEENTYMYDMVFRIFNLNVMPYDKSLLFDRGEYVDNYSKEELSHFDMLFLQAYKYYDQNKAHALIDEYVKGGGSVFIETGWQYKNLDWELKSSPPYLPTNNLVWKDVGIQARMTLDNSKLIGFTNNSQDLGLLSPPGNTWKVSSSDQIRKDSFVLLQSKGIPLMTAHLYGKGRVVHSGFNILAHIEGTQVKNPKEVEFLGNALNWLMEGKVAGENLDTSIMRNNPDKIIFKLNNNTDEYTTLYWRESYYPTWKARLFHDNKVIQLPVYRAGPRLMAMRVPPVNQADKIILAITPGIKDIVLQLLALLTLVYLLFYVIGLTKPLERYLSYAYHNMVYKLSKEKEDAAAFKMHSDPNETEQFETE
jgi:hypothetical protein